MATPEASIPVVPRRAVAALLISTFCSAAAALAQATVLGKQLYDMTGRELDLGLLGLAEFAPAALLVLVTGTVADRFDRRWVGFVGGGVEAVVAIGLGLYMGSKPTAVAPIFVLVLVFGAGRAFGAPATRSLPADIMPPERLPWLVARFSGTWQASIVVGPVLGGFLVAIDPQLPYVAIAALASIAALSLLFIPKPRSRTAASKALADDANAGLEAAVEPSMGHGEAAPPARAGLHEALEGLRFIRREPVLLGAISLDLFAVLFGGAIALLPAIAKDRLGVGPVGLGWLRASGGIGAGIMTLVLAVRPLQRNVGRVLLSVVAAFGLGTIVLGLTRNFWVAFLVVAIVHAADSVSVFIRATLVPLITPERMRGRVLAVENVFIGASNELGAFESGVAGQLLGTAGAVVLGGVATLAVALGWWRFFPGFRDTDRFPQRD